MAGVTQRTVLAARRRRPQARPAAPPLLRQPPSGRPAQPGHERHRQHRPVAPAGLTALITSLLTIVGVLILMPRSARSLRPSRCSRCRRRCRRSSSSAALQQQFVAQWASTGALNGHVEEMHTGHSIVKAFGRQREAIEVFDRENERLFDASRRAQFISGIIQPAMTFISNLNYVAIAVIGGLRVAARPQHRRRRRLHPILAPVHVPDHPDRRASSTSSSRPSPRPSASSARRVRGVRRPRPRGPLDAPVGAVRFEDVSFRYLPEQPLIDDLSLDVSPARPSRSSARRGPARRRSSTC